MGELYGSLWTTENGSDPTPVWSQILNSLSPEIIKLAIQQAEMSGIKYPPNIPQFLAYCRQSAGFPIAEIAYRDAANRRWTHPVVYETCSRVGHFEVRNLPEKAILSTWKQVYEQVCTEYLGGKRFELPERQKLDKPANLPSTPEHASRVLQGLLDQLGPDEPKKKPEIDPNFNDEYDWEGMLKFMGIPYTKHPDGTLTTPRKPSTLRKERV